MRDRQSDRERESEEREKEKERERVVGYNLIIISLLGLTDWP